MEIEHKISSKANRQVKADDVEASRKLVMERGRKQ
jgi:hypothetical protein